MKRWIPLVPIAAGFYLAVSGIFIKQDVPFAWVLSAWTLAFTWLYLLLRLKAFSGPHPVLFLLGTTLGFDLLIQSTGGGQSPLVFAVFLLMGLAAWEGKARFGFLVAFLFGLLEVLNSGKDPVLQGPAPYLRWATLLVSAFLLSKIVKTRQDKKLLDQRLETLQSDAFRLATEAEPSSLNIPRDALLLEESRISARMGTILGLERAINRQLEIFRRTLPCQSAIFFHLDLLGGRWVLRLRSYSSDSKDIAQDLTIPIGETLVGLCAKEGNKILLNHMNQESARALPYYHRPNPIDSFLVVPVMIGDGTEGSRQGQPEMVGVLVLDAREGVFGEKEVELSEKFAVSLAETIQGSRVLHFSKTKSNNLHALFELSKSFSHLLKVEEVLKTALEISMQITPCDSAYIALRERESPSFTVLASKGSWEKEGPRALEEDFTKWMLENKKAIRFSRGQKETIPGLPRRGEAFGPIQSFMILPLLAQEEILGVLRLNSTSLGAFQDYDQDILTTLANQTALAIDNAFKVDKIKALAQRDGLTGAFNHRTFQEKLLEELTKAERFNKDLSLVLLDVDHFKKFNDNYGHQEGDRVLQVVSGVIQSTVRNKVDTLARYGGEEFAVILPEADGNLGKDLAERIRKNVEAHLFEKEGKNLYRVTISVGVASYPFDGRDPKTLIQNADRALYQAKGAGRNCVRRFEKTDN